MFRNGQHVACQAFVGGSLGFGLLLLQVSTCLASEDVSFMNHLESFECLNTRIPCVFATGWKDSKNEAEKDIWKYKVRVFLTLVCFTGIIQNHTMRSIEDRS